MTPWVLVLEDDRDLLHLLGLMLERRGVPFRPARTVSEAEALIDALGPPAVASIDYLLDGQPAVAVLRRLCDAQIPVVLLSDLADDLPLLLPHDWAAGIERHAKANLAASIDAIVAKIQATEQLGSVS